MDEPIENLDAQGPDLHGWKEIADYLRVGVRTAQLWERDLGLPVRRLRGRARAVSAELDEWQRTALQECHEPPQDRFEPAVPSGVRWRSVLLVATGLVTGIAIATVLATVRVETNPTDVRVTAAGIVALDERGRDLWHYTFSGNRINLPSYDGVRRDVVTDLDGDGRNEVIFGAVFDLRKPTNSQVVCLSADGRLRWTYTPGREVNQAGDRKSPPFWVSAVLPIPGPNGVRVAVSSNHHFGAPNQLAVLDSRGKPVGEYWHPGHLLHLASADLDRDGQQELLAAGVNNGESSATLLVFDPERVTGTPVRLANPKFQLNGIAPGAEKAVVFFPRSSVATVHGREQPFNRAFEVYVTGDRVSVGVAESTNEHDPRTIIYQLDYSLRPVGAAPSVGYQHSHNELHRAGLIGHAYDGAAEPQRLIGKVIVRRPGN